MTHNPRRVVAVPMLECRETRCATCPFQSDSAEPFSSVHDQLSEVMEDELGIGVVYRDATDLAMLVFAVTPHFVCHYPLMEGLKADSYLDEAVVGHKIGCKGSHDLLSGALDNEPFVIEARRRLKVASEEPGSEEGLKVRRALANMVVRKLADIAALANQNGGLREADGIVSALRRLVQRKPLVPFTIDDLPGEELPPPEPLCGGFTAKELEDLSKRVKRPVSLLPVGGIQRLHMPELADCEALHAEHPDTFELPDVSVRRGLGCGWLVKLIFEPGERMWVKVTAAHESEYLDEVMYTGVLDNEPLMVKSLKRGDRVAFSPKHIASVEPPPVDYRGPEGTP